MVGHWPLKPKIRIRLPYRVLFFERDVMIGDVVTGTIVQLYAVWQGETDYGGGHPQWYFDDERLAHEVARGRGWYGGKAGVSTVLAISTVNGFFILDKPTPMKLDIMEFAPEIARERALAKLTPEEAKLLGINND